MELRILGPLEAVEGSRTLNVGGARQRVLLARLAVAANRVVSVDALIHELWAGGPLPGAKDALQAQVSRLRRALGGKDRLVARSGGYVLRLGLEELDAARFEALVTQARATAEQGQLEAAAVLLGEAEACWRGPALGEFADYPFAQAEGARLDEARLAAAEERMAAELVLGHHAQVVGTLEALVAAHPLRERLWGQLMVALYRSGRQAEALRAYQDLRRTLAEELGIDPSAELVRLEEAVLLQKPELNWQPPTSGDGQEVPSALTGFIGQQVQQPLPPCPYRGLSAFREEDVTRFFGREELTDRLVGQLERRPVVALVGSSGSGKSSLVFAGAVPRLRRAGWAVAALRPAVGASPLSALATALLPLLEPTMTEAERLLEVGKLEEALVRRGLAEVTDRVLKRQDTERLLLVVDQFEELYAREATVARQFVDVLLQPAAAKQRGQAVASTVVLTLRADFLGQALEQPELADALKDSTLVIGRMTRDQLRPTIEGPLPDEVGFESGLVERIIDDVGDEAGHLALLEFALTVLWERQQGRTLRHAVYEQLGGVEGALARYAEDVYYNELEGSEQKAARLFVQLVRPGGATEPTRRVARRTELDPLLWSVAQGLATTRLVVTGRDEAGTETVELAHEALISGWDRLRQWVEADREFRAWQERLRTDMEQYEASGRDNGALLRGVPLAEAQRWLNERSADIGSAEQDYIRASQVLQGRTVRRLKTFLAGLVALLLLAVTLGISADRQRRRVQEQERLATSRALAAQADATIDDRPVESILLSLQAFNEAPTSEARSSLLNHFVHHSHTRAFIIGHTGRVSAVAFSPDGRTLATVSADKTVKLWDITSRQAVATLTGHTDPGATVSISSRRFASGVAFSSDGHTLATASADKTVRLWNISARRELATLTGHTDLVSAVAFSPDGHTVATSSADTTARLWDVTTGYQLAALPGHTDPVGPAPVSLREFASGLAFSPDGQTLATASGDKTVRLWHVSTRRELAALTGHTDLVSAVAFSPDGRTLATGSADKTVRLWDVGARRELAAFTGHTDRVRNVAFSPDGQTVATASADKTVRLWGINARRQLGILIGHSDWVAGVAFSPDGHTLATASDDHTVRLWNVTAGPELATLAGHNGWVTGVAFSPDGHTLATSGEDHTVRLWDVTAGRPVATLVGHKDWVSNLAFSPDGQTLATAGDTVRIWDIRSRRELASLTGHTNLVRNVAFSPDGGTAATASMDATVRLWDIPGRRELASLAGHSDWVTGVAFSPDGRTVATASADTTIRLWDVPARRQIGTLAGHSDWVSAVAFSPEGHTLATVSADTTVRLWDVRTRRELATLTGHTGWVWGVAFSPDGQILATASEDHTVRLWDVTARREMATFTGHTDTVSSVAFNPDGHILATVGADKAVRLWDMDITSWRRRLCNLAGRNLTPQEWEEFLADRPYQKTCPTRGLGRP